MENFDARFVALNDLTTSVSGQSHKSLHRYVHLLLDKVLVALKSKYFLNLQLSSISCSNKKCGN